jgi:DNA/RNA-binding domain of Phe-tRNA-synthetase-like protein
MSALRIADDVGELGITAVGRVLDELHHPDEHEVAEILKSAEDDVLEDLDEPELVGDRQLVAYRALHERVGAGARHVAAPEALRRMLLRDGRVPRISPLVDLYNAVSLRTRLAIGVHDAGRVVGDVELRRLTGDERFVPIGASEPKRVRAGEYAYVDQASDVLCRLEVQQADKTKITAATTKCLVIVQANAAFPARALADGTRSLVGLLQRYCGARVLE